MYASLSREKNLQKFDNNSEAGAFTQMWIVMVDDQEQAGALFCAVYVTSAEAHGGKRSAISQQGAQALEILHFFLNNDHAQADT